MVRRRRRARGVPLLALAVTVWGLAAAAPHALGAQDTAATTMDSTLAAGIAMFDSAQYADAAVAFETFVAQHPGDPIAPFYLGRISIYQRRSEDAVRWLEMAVRIAPGVSEYHQWLGRAYALQVSEANRVVALVLARKVRPEFARAVRLDPSNVLARMDLVRYDVTASGVIGGGGTRALDRARGQAAEIVRRNPMRGQLAEGMIHEAEEQFTDAVGHYRTAIATYPDSAPPYVALGQLYLRRKRYPEAAAVFERYAQRLPTDWVALLWIGKVAAASGVGLARGAAAVTTYLQALPGEAAPTRGSAHATLGRIYERQGRTAPARSEYQTALALDPSSDAAQEGLARVQ